MKDRSSSGGFFLDNEGQNTLVERYEKEENVSEALGNCLISTLKISRIEIIANLIFSFIIIITALKINDVRRVSWN